LRRLREVVEKFRLYSSVSEMGEIGRRYFVINAFDGAMVILGVVLGAFVAGARDPSMIVSAGLGGMLAMGISGFAGVYISERAERIKRLKDLEKAMLADLGNSVIGDATRFAPVALAVIDGIAPAIPAFVAILPFILCLRGAMLIEQAYALSILLTLVLLFLLGALLGRLSGENVFIYGFVTTFVGLATAALILGLGGN